MLSAVPSCREGSETAIRNAREVRAVRRVARRGAVRLPRCRTVSLRGGTESPMILPAAYGLFEPAPKGKEDDRCDCFRARRNVR